VRSALPEAIVQKRFEPLVRTVEDRIEPLRQGLVDLGPVTGIVPSETTTSRRADLEEVADFRHLTRWIAVQRFSLKHEKLGRIKPVEPLREMLGIHASAEISATIA
jgi:hypothetical protein